MVEDLGERALNDYAHAFATLTPCRVNALCERVSEDVHFRDPFNDLHGRDALRRLLIDMFARTEQPVFDLDEICWQASGRIGWLRWRFSACLPVVGRLHIEGCSRVIIDENGRVCEHFDYWDSAPVYFRLPFIGRLLGVVYQRISSSHGK